MHQEIGKIPPGKPSFMFIGPSKSGSSWFFEILREHPQVFVPANKATFFFTENFGKGPAWYQAFFHRAPTGRVVGEVCHDYLAVPDALEKIHAYRSDMRLICCLRNPYARALSSWRFFGRNGMDQPTLAAQGETNASVFGHGHYATHLRVLRSIFPEHQILIFFFEELATDPEGVARRLYDFIGVDSRFQPPSLHKKINVNAKPRSRALARLMQLIHQESWRRSHVLSNLIGQTKRIRLLRHVVRSALYTQPVSSTDWRDHLSEFPESVIARYEEEISGLEVALGKDLSHWRAPGARPPPTGAEDLPEAPAAKPRTSAAMTGAERSADEAAVAAPSPAPRGANA